MKERRPIRILEMVPFSAGELLKKEGHLTLLEQLEGEEGLVEIVQVGSFYDVNPGSHVKNTAELAAFRIRAEKLEENGLRIVGECHYSKDELKKFLKVLDRFKEGETLSEEMGYRKEGAWLESGLLLMRKLHALLKKELFPLGVEVKTSTSQEKLVLWRKLELPVVYEEQDLSLKGAFFGKDEESYRFLLQSIAKTLTMLGFDQQSVSKGRMTDYWVEDELGRKRPLVHVKKISGKGSSLADILLEVEVEQIFFLLLEQNRILQVV